MDKGQISQGTHAGVLSTNNRQLLWPRFFLLVLFLALSLSSLQPRAAAQAGNQTLRADKVSVTSHQPRASAPNCERAYVECLAGGGGAICDIQYNVCIESYD